MSRLQSEVTVDINDDDRRCIDSAEGSNTGIDSSPLFKPVSNFAQAHHCHENIGLPFLCLLDQRLNPAGAGLILEQGH